MLNFEIQPLSWQPLSNGCNSSGDICTYLFFTHVPNFYIIPGLERPCGSKATQKLGQADNLQLGITITLSQYMLSCSLLYFSLPKPFTSIKRVHVQWFKHSSKTAMGEISHTQEPLLTAFKFYTNMIQCLNWWLQQYMVYETLTCSHIGSVHLRRFTQFLVIQVNHRRYDIPYLGWASTLFSAGIGAYGSIQIMKLWFIHIWILLAF